MTRFGRRLGAIHSNHKRIAAGALLIGALTLVAKLFVAAREVAIAWRHGVSSTVDAYQLSLTATTWAPMMIIGVMAVVLVPRLVKLERQGDERERFIAELNASVLIVGMATAALTWLAAPAVAALLASHMDARTLGLTATMTAQMAPVALFMVASGYLFARLQSRERYGYTVTEALPALAIALFVIIQPGVAGASALIAGTVIGYLLQLMVLGALVVRSDPPLGGLRVRHHSNEWESLYGPILLMVLGQLLISASIPIDQGFAARMGEGAVATLGYANRIVTLFSGLATIVVGRALLPVLSGAVADGDLAVGRRHALQWSVLLFWAAAVGSSIAWIAAPDLVRLLFQRGAFTAAASAHVSHLLRYGLLQLPPYFAGIALVQWYAASSRFRSILFITAVALVVKILLNVIFAPVLGVVGIMVSTAAMYGVTFCLLAVGMRNYKGRSTSAPLSLH